MPAPLLPDDPDMLLNLQQTFAAVYNLLGYDLAIDYTRLSDFPLEGKAALVAESLLPAAGLRSA